jgi:hypothetical protein
MDTEALVRWALDDARTIEERYTVELVVEAAVQKWFCRHQPGGSLHWQEKVARDRQRRLNPAYEPSYSEADLCRAAETLAAETKFELTPWGYSTRIIRDIAILRYLPHVEEVLVNGDIPDCAVFAELPRLRGLSFGSRVCDDYRPIARCTGLRSLSLTIGRHWPEVSGLERLELLEGISLKGNLLVFPPGTTYPRVHTATLACEPLAARDVRSLPQVPACEILNLTGVDRLDGIEAMPGLRNLTLNAAVRSFEPLTVLRELTGFSHCGVEPLDVEPLARVPRLHYLSLQTSHAHSIEILPLRDLSPLLAAPSLRELHQKGCPPLDLEVAAINAALPPCDDLFLAPEPRPIPPVPRMVVAPISHHPKATPEQGGAIVVGPIDQMVRACEVRWVRAYFDRQITAAIGHSDWGKVHSYAASRNMDVTVESYEVVERLPTIVDAIRAALARVRADYRASLSIHLCVPPPPPSPAQKELERQFRDAQDEAEFRQREADRLEALEQQYLYQLKQQEGAPIDPEEFAASPVPREEDPSAEDDEDLDDEEEDDGEGGVAEKKKPMPNPIFLSDDEHPLADQYRLWSTVTLDTVYFLPHARDIAIHLMAREPDVDLPAEPKTPAS